jgi:hypothetical protein
LAKKEERTVKAQKEEVEEEDSFDPSDFISIGSDGVVKPSQSSFAVQTNPAKNKKQEI